MANHKSVQKRIRQTAKRTVRNRYYRTRIKNVVKSVRVAISDQDIQKANEMFKIANKELHEMVSKGVLKKATAARRVSRLNNSVKKLAMGE